VGVPEAIAAWRRAAQFIDATLPGQRADRRSLA
jgi:hypothetical protein